MSIAAARANHTKGPWKTFSRLDAYGLPEIVVAADSGCPIAAVGNHAEFKANAVLMSAAPDLRDALIEAKKELWLTARTNWTMADFKNWAVVQMIDAALEKSDGIRRTREELAGA